MDAVNSDWRLAAKCIRFAIAAYLLLATAGGAKADGQSDYLAAVKDTFEHMSHGKRFVPSGSACGHVPGRCDVLLGKLASSDFSFIAPIERSDRPDMPTFRRIQDRCRDLRSLRTLFNGVPAVPTRGFALYRMPPSAASGDAQKIYILRAEDYVSEINPAEVLNDGSLIIFAYPACRVLKEISIEKSHKSPYASAAPNLELDWIAEPILLNGKKFIVSIHAINGTTPNQPLYVLRLTSVSGFAGSGGEAYSFSAKRQ